MKKYFYLIFSLIIALSGIIFLCSNVLYHIYPPVAYPSNFFEYLTRTIYDLEDKLPVLGLILGFLVEGAFLVFIPFSILGIWLSYQSLKFSKFAILGIILNSITLLFSLLIAWLLFGLARGM